MLNLLKEAINKKMDELCDSPKEIIFEKHKATPGSLEMCIIIVKIASVDIPRFRVYKGIKYNSSISVEYFTLEEDMFAAMTSNLKVNLGEVQ